MAQDKYTYTEARVALSKQPKRKYETGSTEIHPMHDYYANGNLYVHLQIPDVIIEYYIYSNAEKFWETFKQVAYGLDEDDLLEVFDLKFKTNLKEFLQILVHGKFAEGCPYQFQTYAQENAKKILDKIEEKNTQN